MYSNSPQQRTTTPTTCEEDLFTIGNKVVSTVGMRTLLIAILAITSTFISGCGTDVKNKINDAIDIVNGVDEKDVDRSKLGVNAFFNDGRFGTLSAQAGEIQNTLKISRVRILFNWDDNVQPTPSSSPNFAFYDAVLSALPAGMDALVILTNTPSWMSNSKNWVNGNPRETFVEKWVRPVVARYGANGRISSWQIWNEPNQPNRRDNANLELETSPENFVELVTRAYNVCKEIAPNKLVVNGSTTAINQNFPGSLNYNRAMRDAGLFSVIDVFGMHYYGRQFENVIRGDGVQEFTSSIPKPIWVTESGAQGVNEQLKYVRQVWPFLSEKIPSIDRFYYYQMYESTDPSQTYGLRNLSTSAPLSDLYINLRSTN